MVKEYGDEKLGYKIPVRNMTPVEARNCLESISLDCLGEKMDQRRYSALRIRAEEQK